MRWDKVDAMWQKRGEAPPGKVMPGTDVSYELKQYEIPGESPLDVRVVKRTGIDPKKYQFATSVPRTAIMLHVTAGYGNFADLMGGNGAVSANYLLGRDGNAYECVPPEMLAWHANDWSPNSIGIEIDNIGPLTKNGNNLAGWTKDTYCTLDDKGVYMETTWPSRAYIKYWAAFTEAQYLGVARLIKALAHKFQIPRVILPDAQRYDPVDKAVRTKWKGLITHVQTNPANRADIGPVIDWDKLIRYADIELGDPVSGPAYKPPTNPTPGFAAGGGGTPAPAGGDTPAPSGGGSTPAAPTPPPPAPSTPASASGGSAAPSGGGTPPVAPSAPPPQPMSQQTTQDMVDLPAPIRVSDNVMKVAVGKRGGRIAFSLRRPGDPVPTPPKPGDLPAPMAEGKRDDFIRDAMNFLGAPYKKGSNKPNEGVDGPGLIGLCLKRVGLLADSKDEDLDADHLAHYWAQCGGTVDAPPEHILPGDLAWYGSGDHDTKPQQVPFINLGGGRLLGPVPGGANDGAVQIIHAKDVPEKFAGWQHIDDLGVATNMSGHPGDHAAPGEKLSGALLPLDPAGRYDALKAIVEKKGGTWLSEKNAVNLIGIKNMSDRCLISATPQGWNDDLFAAFTDDSGNKCCLELKSSLNPENDQDKVDTWQLQEGTWKFKLTDGDGTAGAKALQPDEKIKGWLDKDGMGAPRGGNSVPPLETKIDPIPAPPQANPKHPENADNPANLPPSPPADNPKPVAKTVGDWESCIDGDAVPDDVCAAIDAARKAFTTVTLKPVPAGKNMVPNPRVFVNPDAGHKAWCQGVVADKIRNAASKLEKFQATALRALLGREGGTSDFNLWDSQIVTWGMGFGGLGGLGLVMNALQANPSGEAALHNLGVKYLKGRYHVVDTGEKKVISSEGTKHKTPLLNWSGNDDIISAFVGIATAPDTRMAVLEANFKAFKSMSASFDRADVLDSQAAFNFIAHLYHWMPGYANNSIKAAQDAGKSGDVEICTYAAQRFATSCRKHNVFSAMNRNIMIKLWDELQADGLDVPKGSTMDWDTDV